MVASPRDASGPSDAASSPLFLEFREGRVDISLVRCFLPPAGPCPFPEGGRICGWHRGARSCRTSAGAGAPAGRRPQDPAAGSLVVRRDRAELDGRLMLDALLIKMAGAAPAIFPGPRTCHVRNHWDKVVCGGHARPRRRALAGQCRGPSPLETFVRTPQDLHSSINSDLIPRSVRLSRACRVGGGGGEKFNRRS